MTARSTAQFDALRAEIYATSFSPQNADVREIGAEVELLAHDVATNRPIPLTRGARALVPMIRDIAARERWHEFAAYDGTPRFEIPHTAIISFEPGGQVEISSVPCATVTQLVAKLERVIATLRVPLIDQGVELRAVGIDPFNDARDIPLQLEVARYQRMTEYFERISPFGIRMMRQTAAIQVSLDRGTEPARRWRMLNDLTPYLIAMFANSPIYLGADPGERSFRAQCWRRLDPSRTGIAEEDADPAGAYAEWALRAGDMMRLDAAGRHRAFEYWLGRSPDDRDRWPSHLTTLFPEVRPRGHYEVRSCDAVPLEWQSVPIVVLAGITYDRAAASEAALLAAESRALLRAAGEQGMGDANIARTARDLFQLALDGASRLGEDYISSELIDTARGYQARYTSRDRSPADDARDALRARTSGSAIRSPI